MPELKVIQVTKASELEFGDGQIGLEPSLHPAEETAFASALGAHTRGLWKSNTADCGDGRKTLRLVQAEKGMILIERVVPQLLGGTGLAATKAAVAANARLIADAKNMWQAYQIISTHLYEEWNEEDGGHEGCGASKAVRSSVADRIDPAVLIPSICAFSGANEQTVALARQNWQTTGERLRSGFYDGWDPERHADYLASRFPQNFSYLEKGQSDDPLAGHRELAVYFVTESGHGFAKNAFVEATGQQAFSVTLPKMRELANKLGGSADEKERIFLAFLDDTLHVTNGLAAKGMPIFTEAVGG